MSEADAFFRNPIDVRRLVVGAAFNGEVPDPEVISEDEDDIGPGREGVRRRIAKDEEGGEKNSDHGKQGAVKP